MSIIFSTYYEALLCAKLFLMFYDLIPIILLRVQYYPQFTDDESMTQKVGIISIPKCAQMIVQARIAGKDFRDSTVVSWFGSL